MLFNLPKGLSQRVRTALVSRLNCAMATENQEVLPETTAAALEATMPGEVTAVAAPNQEGTAETTSRDKRPRSESPDEDLLEPEAKKSRDEALLWKKLRKLRD